MREIKATFYNSETEQAIFFIAWIKFVPRVGETVVFGRRKYRVVGVSWDFDFANDVAVLIDTVEIK